MKLFLDDERTPPDKSWTLVKTGKEAIKLLQTREVKSLSLDHDLGDSEITGYTVISWIEEQVVLNNFIPPAEIKIHSANPVGRKRISQVIKSIRRFMEKR